MKAEHFLYFGVEVNFIWLVVRRRCCLGCEFAYQNSPHNVFNDLYFSRTYAVQLAYEYHRYLYSGVYVIHKLTSILHDVWKLWSLEITPLMEKKKIMTFSWVCFANVVSCVIRWPSFTGHFCNSHCVLIDFTNSTHGSIHKWRSWNINSFFTTQWKQLRRPLSFSLP